jgi:hypothetical protein
MFQTVGNTFPRAWNIFRLKWNTFRADGNEVHATRNEAGSVAARLSRTFGREDIHHRDAESTEKGEGVTDQGLLRAPGSNSSRSQRTKFSECRM